MLRKANKVYITSEGYILTEARWELSFNLLTQKNHFNFDSTF